MKKALLFAAGFALTLAACQTEKAPLVPAEGEQIITVNIPSGMSTRATAADFGTGSHVDRCILQIYRNDSGEEYSRHTAEVVNNQATFSLRLVAAQTYDFVFWADDKDNARYDTDDMKAIKLADGTPYAGNDDTYDAFTGTLLNYKVTGAFSEAVELRRPFGQLNVVTKDMSSIPDTATDLKPTQVKVNFTALPTTFNALTGEVGAETAAFEYTADVLSADGDLTVDYILAPVTEAALADFSMTFLKADGSTILTNSDFTNIPIRRNYRTNVSGNLLTKQGEINVTVVPEFKKPDITYVFDEPQLRKAFAEGGNVELTKDMFIEAPLVVTDVDKPVILNMQGKNIVNTTSMPDKDPALGNTNVFEVLDHGNLTIEGTDDTKIHAISKEPNQDGYRMAVWARGNSTVTINGGNYYNKQDYNNDNAQLDLIYASENATIIINGGRFESASHNNRGYWVLNVHDGAYKAGTAKIIVKGGTFVNYNPAESYSENPVANFVAEGYESVKISDLPAPNGTWQVQAVVPQP